MFVQPATIALRREGREPAGGSRSCVVRAGMEDDRPADPQAAWDFFLRVRDSPPNPAMIAA
jgi:hypothetical protein